MNTTIDVPNEAPKDAKQALQRLDAQVPTQVAAPSVAGMLQAVIDKGVTAENVAAVEQIVKLYEHMQEKDAEKEFIKSYVAMQREMVTVQATKAVLAKDGTVKFKVASMEEIDKQARPIYQRHGFAVSFREAVEHQQGKVTKVCVLQHVSGHKQDYPYTVRVGSGPPGCTESQADGSAHSYSKRGALCDALNIVIGHSDDDPRAEGASITEEQADELQRRVAMSNSNLVAFLKFCGVSAVHGTIEDFRKIPASRYEAADEMLSRKEKQGR